MSGLLEKATPLHEQIMEVESIPQAERDHIYADINRSVDRVRIHLLEESIQIHPMKKGRTFPLILNIVTFCTVLLIVVLLFSFFGKSNNQIIASTAALNLTENRIINTLREESDRQLSAKENEIVTIQREMLGLLDEKSLLLIETKRELEELEAELQQKMDQRIGEEEERLQELNWDKEAIDEELNSLRSTLQERYSNQLLGVIAREEEKRFIREKELNGEISRLAEELSQANQDKEELTRQNRTLEERALSETPALSEEEKARYQSLIQQGQDALSNAEERLNQLSRKLEQQEKEEQAFLEQYRIESEKRLNLLTRINGVYTGLRAIPESVWNTSDEADLISLLNQKIYIKEALASDAVRQQYPDVHNRLDEYLDNYGALMENRGKNSALQEVENMLSAIAEEESYLPSADNLQQKELYEEILLKLDRMLQSTSREE